MPEKRKAVARTSIYCYLGYRCLAMDYNFSTFRRHPICRQPKSLRIRLVRVGLVLRQTRRDQNVITPRHNRESFYLQSDRADQSDRSHHCCHVNEPGAILPAFPNRLCKKKVGNFTMKIKLTSFVTISVVSALLTSASLWAGNATFEVTFTNLTRSQTFTPILVTSHKQGFGLFELGEMASDDLAALAEGGGHC